MPPLTPTNVLMTVGSDGAAWFYTTDNKILTGMGPTGSIFYQHAITALPVFTQFAVNASTAEIYYTTGLANANTVFVSSIRPPPLVSTPYINSSEPSATLKYLTLSQDDTVLYQIYNTDNIYACIGGSNSLALNYPGILSVYAKWDTVYYTGILVITQPTLFGVFERQTINYTGAPMTKPAAIGSPLEIAPSTVPYAELVL
jgi:hypothetical protein